MPNSIIIQLTLSTFLNTRGFSMSTGHTRPFFSPFISIVTVFFALNLLACSAPQTYHKNRFYTDNVQQRLNIDLPYCDAVARANTPIVIPQTPQYPTTTYGNGVIFDNMGNYYNLTYNNRSIPSPQYSMQHSLNNLSLSLQRSRIYSAIKEQCLAEKGWYQISKEEYEQSLQPTKNY